VKDDAAFGGTVQFGQHDPGDLDDLAEHPSLSHAVLTGGGIQYQ
jgi:hypothetical protein